MKQTSSAALKHVSLRRASAARRAGSAACPSPPRSAATAQRANMSEATAHAPNNARLHIAYAQAQQARGKAGYAKALDAYARATKLTLAQHGGDARSVPAFLWNNVAVLRHEMAELPEASVAYERALECRLGSAADAAAAAASLPPAALLRSAPLATR